MHSFLASDLVRQHSEEVNKKAEQAARRRPPRAHPDERVVRRVRHDGE